MITNWTCTIIDASTTDCVVTASTTDDFATSTAPFSHDEFLFVIMVAIVLLGVPFWRFLFSWGKK